MFLFGALQGFGASILYVLPVKICWEYFPNIKGVVSGIIIGFYGLGSFSFNLIGSHFINPDGINKTNGFYPEEVFNWVPSSLRYLCLIYVCLSIVTLVLLKPKKKEIKIEPIEDINETEDGKENLISKEN